MLDIDIRSLASKDFRQSTKTQHANFAKFSDEATRVAKPMLKPATQPPMTTADKVRQDWEKIYSDMMAIDSMRAIGRRVSSTNVGIHTFLAESLNAHQIGAADNSTKRLVITLITDQWINLAAG